MIRINLLPVPKTRKQEALILQTAIGIITLMSVAGVCYFVGLAKKSAITDLNKEIQNVQTEIDKLKAKVGEVEKFKKEAALLEQQLGVIRNLEKGRAGPVKMMDEFTALIPRKLWVTSFKEAAKKVNIEGVAESGTVIADFLDNIKSAKYFQNPQLSSVQGQDLDGQKVHKFIITMQVKYDI
jgi:type IV pilus assembly protein PilN